MRLDGLLGRGIPALMALGLAACATGEVDDNPFDVPDVPRDDARGETDVTSTDDGTADVCGAGETMCGTACVPLMTDPRNCGGCGVICPPGQVCSIGACSSECSGTLTRCGDSCVDLGSDPRNCRVCGNVCPGGINADGACESGECVLRCREGWRDIDGTEGCEYECTFASPTESCNGVDDDCDGSRDEGFACTIGEATSCTTSCGSMGTGPCTLSCAIPTGSGCIVPAETCNGRDDDCDAACDDGFGCCLGETGSCTTGTGGPGVRTCGAGCVWGTCSASGEACNGVDDDSDTLCDEDFGCCRGTSGTCTTTCGSAGTRTCATTCNWGSCSAPAETCNGIDDDCDGACDNGLACCRGASGSCTTSCGTAGARICSASCTWGGCSAPAETCNGADDDCDGACDNGFACCAGGSGSCTTSCGSAGTRTCSATCSWGTCLAPAETCNGIDDDCDGGCDNGFACCAGRSTTCTEGSCSGTATCTSSCTSGACNFGAAPANDSCSGTIPTITSTTSQAFSTCPATNDYTASCGASAASADLVYRLSLASRSTVTISTSGSDFDPVLHLHSGASCPGTEVACNDDFSGAESQVSGTYDAGTYWIVVDGYSSSNRGAGTLNVTVTPLGPANDNCSSAIDITSLTSVTGTTVGATGDHSTSSCGCTSGNDVWYRFTLSSRSVVWLMAQHSGSGDLSLHVHSGSCTGAVPSGACNDDSCPRPGDGWTRIPQVATVLDAGTYYVAVDGCTGDAFTLNFRASAPGTDTPAGTTNFLSGSGTRTGTTSGSNDVNPGSGVTCATSSSAAEHVYFFTVCPTASKSAAANTCTSTNYDSYLYAKRDNVQTGSQLACDDDSCGSADATISFAASGPGIFFLVVDGWSTGTGSYSLAYSGL